MAHHAVNFLHLQPTSPYSYVRTKKVRVAILPDSRNKYSTVPKEGSPLPCAEISPLAGLCDDSTKAAEVVMSYIHIRYIGAH